MDYKQFSSADFICDEHFQNWMIKPEKESDDFWNNWLLQNPDKRETIQEAKQILLNLKFREHFPTQEQAQHSLASVLSDIGAFRQKPQKGKAAIIHLRAVKKIVKIAAIFIGIALTGSMIYYTYWNAKMTISTRYSEVKKVFLPGGSLVVLNAHSAISYLKHVRKNQPRRVWLEGEAFFDVKHINKNENDIKDSERVVVSTQDLNINVLGTSFNVKKRAEVTEVILQTGKIRVVFNNKWQPDITMVPGEMIAYDNKQHPVLKYVDPVAYTTWRDKKLTLQDASVNEIAQYIQDYYGYKVILEDTAIGNKKIEGTLLLEDMQDVLFALSSTLDINIEKQKNTLIFKKRK